jgi:hypothetical protein
VFVHLIINFNYLQHDGTTEHNMADTQVLILNRQQQEFFLINLLFRSRTFL